MGFAPLHPSVQNRREGIFQGARQRKDMDLIQTISVIRERIADPRYQSEGAVRELIILPILRQLGWDEADPDVVVRDVDLAGQHVDYGLAVRPTRPNILIRVKKSGRGGGQDRDLLEYASNESIQMVCLTDGREWDFYLPGEHGPYEERRLYKLDLVEREPQESHDVLERYAGFDRVKSGAAFEDAKREFREASQHRLAAQSIPRAWRELIEEPDELLIELIAERTESICGYRPNADEIEKFLVEHVRSSQRAPISGPKPVDEVGRRAARSQGQPGSSRIGYGLLGENHSAPNAIEAVVEILQVLSKRSPDFWSKLAPLTRLRKRTHFARSRDEIFPDRPDLEQYIREIAPGWYLNTNMSNTTKKRLLEAACRAANLRFGRDLQIQLPNT
jgi:predicted type IV restriction endonuclease